MAAQHLLSKGLRKAIGTGSETRVWKDKWIPKIHDGETSINLMTATHDPDMKVDRLIDQSTKTWDTQLLKEYFPQSIVTQILSIKIPRIPRRDRYIWCHSKSGSYSVRTGYEQARSNHMRAGYTLPEEPSFNKLKEYTWKIKAPRKLKHFIWQSLSGCLATCQRLAARHLGTSGICPRCGDTEETINHLLFECPPAFQVWALSDIPTAPGVFPRSSLAYNIDFLFSRMQKSKREESQQQTYPWILWYIWKARNERIFKDVTVLPQTTLQLAMAEAQAWEMAAMINLSFMDETINSSLNLQSMQPDSEASYAICTTDASWAEGGDAIGLGWRCHSPNGTLLFGLKREKASKSALHAELRSTMWSMKSLLDKQILSVKMYTDCESIIKMTEDQATWIEFSEELQKFEDLRSRFNYFHLSHISRDFNQVADYLAKASRRRCDYFSQVSDVLPPWLPSLEALLRE